MVLVVESLCMADEDDGWRHIGLSLRLYLTEVVTRCFMRKSMRN